MLYIFYYRIVPSDLLIESVDRLSAIPCDFFCTGTGTFSTLTSENFHAGNSCYPGHAHKGFDHKESRRKDLQKKFCCGVVAFQFLWTLLY